MAIIRSNAGAHARRTRLTKVGTYPKSVGSFRVSSSKEGGRSVWIVTGFAKKAKKTYYNEANAADFMRRQAKYDRTGTSAGGTKSKRKSTAKRSASRSGSGISSFAQAGTTLRRLGFKGKLTTKALDTVSKRRAKISQLKKKGATGKKWEGVRRKKGSSFAEAGVTLRRLGYTGKLTGKNLDTLAKRRKKIKALKAKGGSAKKWEGVRRAKKQVPARRRKSTKGRKRARRNPSDMSDAEMIDFLLDNPAQLDFVMEEDYLY